MSSLKTLLVRQFRDLLRTRAVTGYVVFIGLSTAGLLQFGGGAERSLPSLATLVVLVVPLVSILITTTYLYHSGDFIELILSHPVGRRPLFASLFLGLLITLAGAFLLGVSFPFLTAELSEEAVRGLMILLMAGAFLTAIFVALGFLVAFKVTDPARGNGAALLIWLSLAVLYDGVVLFAAYRWAAYPLETPMLLLMALNPVDVARVLVIMGLDASAMMGYTGAVFQDFFGGSGGMVLAIACLAMWVVVPGLGALRVFSRKDF